MKKVLVLGSNGMAGHVVKMYLEGLNLYQVIGVARGIEFSHDLICLDVFETTKLEDIFRVGNFDYVVNCIGLLNETAERNPEKAIWFNSYFPHLLTSFGEKYDFKLIHISTDCVFSGMEGGYSEESFKDGIGYYSQTKALGEVVNDRDLTFRTSIIGPELKLNGIGLFHWFMNQTGEVLGFKKALWSGVTTIELAKAIHAAIQQNLTGLYHLVNNSKISKHDLINLFNYEFKGGSLKIIESLEYKVDKSLINNRDDFKFQVPTYHKMIAEMKNWVALNSDSYPHYSLNK